jgi:luciferase-like monooxygenase
MAMSVDGAGAGERVRSVVASWPGVETAAHRFGGTEFRFGRRELGHVHGDRIADLPFPRKVRDELIVAGRAQAHHVLPDSGWVTASLGGPDGAEHVIELFGLSYGRAVRAAGRRARPSGEA